MRLVITNFDAVGRLLLPWRTVQRPWHPSVRELANPAHPALHVHHTDHGGWTHAERASPTGWRSPMRSPTSRAGRPAARRLHRSARLLSPSLRSLPAAPGG